MLIVNKYYDSLEQNEYEDEAAYYWDNKSSYTSISYSEIFQVQSYVSKWLSEHVIKKHTCIGLWMNHNLLIPSLILSFQECEIAFVFLDPNADGFVNDSITDKLGVKWIISVDKPNNDKLILKSTIDSKGKKLYLWQTHIREEDTSFQNICYVIFTSGTTGQPKLVKVQYNCIVSNIKHLTKIFETSKTDLIYFGTPLTFDPSMIELFLSLCTAAKLVMVSPILKLNTRELIQVLFPQSGLPYKGVSFIQTVPSLFLRWGRAMEFITKKSTLKVLALGGETFPKQFSNWSSSLRVFNLYGITELSCWASIFELKNGDYDVNLGDVLEETIFEVRNPDGIVTEGEGELYIGSNTRICLLDNEQENLLPKPVFRATGDVVSISNKTIFYKGRVNRTIKRFGIKIDLNMLEEQILKSLDIQNRCVYLEHVQKLIVFIALDEFNFSTKHKIVDKIRVQLLHNLSKEYQPDCIEIIPKFPLTQHGKLDESTLKEIYSNTENSTFQKEPSVAFMKLICKYLGINEEKFQLYSDCNFFQTGGNSFMAIQFLNEFKEVTGCDNFGDLTNLLFEKSFKDCLQYLSNPSVLKIRHHTTVPQNNKRMKVEFYGENNMELTVKWKYNLEACVDSSPTIIRTNKELFSVAIGAFSHIFSVVDGLSGKETMKTVLPDAIESPCLFFEDYIYTGCYDGKLYCISLLTSQIIWKYQTEDRIKSTPCLCIENNALAFGSYDKYAYCINKIDGLLIWKINLGESINSNVIAWKSMLYVATMSGTCLKLNEAGEILWKTNVGSPIFTSACIFEDAIIWADVTGHLHGFNALTGNKLWNFQVTGNIFASPLQYKKFLLFGTHSSNFYCVELEENSLRSKITLELDSGVNSTPSILSFKDKCYGVVSTIKGGLYVIDIETGIIAGQFMLPGEVFSSPVAENDSIFIGCRDNNLYCLSMAEKT